MGAEIRSAVRHCPRDTHAPPLAGRRVVIVDDIATNRLVLRLMLEPLGLSVAEAGCGIEALDMLAAEPADLVLSDLNMPGIDGIETVRRLRGMDGLKALPVALVTADTRFMLGEVEHALGIFAVIRKPVIYEELTMLAVDALTTAGTEGRAVTEPWILRS